MKNTQSKIKPIKIGKQSRIIKIFKTKNKLTTNVIKIRWRLVAWSVEKILIILTQKYLEQKIIDLLCNQFAIDVLFAELKSQDLLKNKKQKVYWVI